jgi:hypothetical protein
MDIKIRCAHTQFCRNFNWLMKTVSESPSVPDLSIVRTVVFAAIIFVIAHFTMLIGITTPEKFYFDEVHYVPAARQMLEP